MNFEDLWKHQQGALFLKEENSSREWKKSLAEYFYRMGQDHIAFKLNEEIINLKQIIKKELNENDEFGSEFVIASILRKENEIFKEKLNIAIEAIEDIGSGYNRTCTCCDGGEFKYDLAREALDKIKELDNETNKTNS
ncbi:MAG: hypothetical protein IPI17_02155 [Nitrosomonas sp.]|nr:hypothetical protein [Nitrosomonas sp.]